MVFISFSVGRKYFGGGPLEKSHRELRNSVTVKSRLTLGREKHESRALLNIGWVAELTNWLTCLFATERERSLTPSTCRLRIQEPPGELNFLDFIPCKQGMCITGMKPKQGAGMVKKRRNGGCL